MHTFKQVEINVRVTTYTTDALSFEVGSDISLHADQTSFASGKGNAAGSTFAKALLTANNKTNTSTMNYYLYLNISNNTFTYTQNTSIPELLLTITDASGNAVADITSLKYKTVTDGKGASISGYDITNKNGLITLFDNKALTANPTKTDQWNITVTFINYNADQSNNMGKEFNAKLMIQQEKLILAYHDYCNDNSLACHIAKQYTGTQGKNSMYYHDSDLENGTGDNSYRYAGGDYVLTEAGKVTGATVMTGYDETVTTSLIDFYCNGTKEYVGYVDTNCSSAYYLIKGETTQYETYNEALNASVEKGYLTKDNVKNFVCFGSEASTCPTDNLYRIIGVIDNKVKLIKYDYATSVLLGTDGDYYGLKTPESTYKGSLSSVNAYYWNYKNDTTINDDWGSNTWSTSLLNKTNLNINFINKIGGTWANKIATTTWKVGGNTFENIALSVPSIAFQNEIVGSVENTTYDAKIGLMYVSDYGFSAKPSAWTLTLLNDGKSTATNDNWMYMGMHEWTISRDSDTVSNLFSVRSYGYVDESSANSDYNGVRPVFNLESTVAYVSGSGTQSDPIRIA